MTDSQIVGQAPLNGFEFSSHFHKPLRAGAMLNESDREARAYHVVYSGLPTSMRIQEEGPISDKEDITGLLDAAADGDRGATDQLYGAVYEELHRIARNNRSRWRGDDTMNTTALIHETYLKLSHQSKTPWRNRGHFFATAAKAMRHVLVNYAKRRRTAKRGGDAVKVPFEDFLVVDDDTALELLAVEQALTQLENESKRACRVFECRVFGGLSMTETADALQISKSTVRRDWAFATAMVHGTSRSSRVEERQAGLPAGNSQNQAN